MRHTVSYTFLWVALSLIVGCTMVSGRFVLTEKVPVKLDVPLERQKQYAAELTERIYFETTYAISRDFRDILDNPDREFTLNLNTVVDSTTPPAVFIEIELICQGTRDSSLHEIVAAVRHRVEKELATYEQLVALRKQIQQTPRDARQHYRLALFYAREFKDFELAKQSYLVACKIDSTQKTGDRDRMFGVIDATLSP